MGTIRRRVHALPSSGLLVAALLAGPTAAAQQVDPQSLGAAQAVFDSAQSLMASRRYDEACPKFEEVVRLVPAGVGAKMQLAKCYDEAGRLASAWAAYLVAENAARTAGQADRAKTAAERAAALKPRLSTLVIAVPEALRGVAGLEIKRDGAVVSQAQWGVAVPVDRGAHAITAAAPKKKPWQGSVDVKSEASATSIPLPAGLDDAAEAAAPPPAKGGAPSPPPDAAPQGGVPAWAWAVGAVGIAGVGVSLGFLMDERGAQSSIDTNCNTRTCVKGFDAHAANGRLYRDFDIFIGAGVAGVVALGASIAGIATAPKKQKSAVVAPPVPWFAPGAAGLGWGGRF
jgi:tetratricopeptide (TPR) repeat protein